MTDATIGWGIVGTGPVAQRFARALATVPGARLVGVVSGRRARAEAFAAAHGPAAVFDEVGALAADPAVAVVYVASPTRLHLAHGLAVIGAGKALLCEKPFTGDPDEAARLAGAARAASVFAMEAMWLRFNTRIAALRAAIAAGRIGRVTGFDMAVGYAQPDATLADRDARLGALPVFGCYGISLAIHLLGPARRWSARIERNPAGTDIAATVTLEHDGAVATIAASVRETLANRLVVTGDRGTATIPGDVIDPGLLDFGDSGFARRTVRLRRRLPAARRARESGLVGEIGEAMRCLRAGLPESDVMPLDETVAIRKIEAELLAG